MRRVLSSAGAGHTIRGKYRVYGEGSVHHNGHPCEHGLNLDRHPVVVREDFDSIWHWLRSELSAWYFERFVLHRQSRNFGLIRRGEAKKLVWRTHPLDRFVTRFLGPSYPRVPRVDAGLWPKDSIYDRDDDANTMIQLEPEGRLIIDHDISPAEFSLVHDWWEANPDKVLINGELVPGCPIPVTWQSRESWLARLEALDKR